MNLSLVVPATDDPPTLRRCRDAVGAASEPPDEVIVVTAPRGSGPAAARNDGAARATSTSRFEFDEFREPITSRTSTCASSSFAAHCRLEVA